MSGLSAFGLLAVIAMVLCYAFENLSPWFTFAFAISCVLGSIYGFLQGAWPFGLVECIWSAIAVRKWWIVRRRPNAWRVPGA
jgi:hypothetical protein